MQNLVLSPIDPETLISRISEKVTANILKAFATSPNPEKKELLSIKEAGAFLNLSIATIYSKVSRRELPCLKQNNRLYFIESELMDFLKAGRKQTYSEIAEATLNGLKKEGGAK
jgi:predicted DNA-binding transcriptional regulator AlpA